MQNRHWQARSSNVNQCVTNVMTKITARAVKKHQAVNYMHQIHPQMQPTNTTTRHTHKYRKLKITIRLKYKLEKGKWWRLPKVCHLHQVLMTFWEDRVSFFGQHQSLALVIIWKQTSFERIQNFDLEFLQFSWHNFYCNWFLLKTN